MIYYERSLENMLWEPKIIAGIILMLDLKVKIPNFPAFLALIFGS